MPLLRHQRIRNLLREAAQISYDVTISEKTVVPIGWRVCDGRIYRYSVVCVDDGT